ncbi:MAG TPA: DNA-3-methyladenine glycosylase 2 family protein [Xanthobacteraceae bacterium]|jgi:DNA-3-methyladenine glycosylase II
MTFYIHTEADLDAALAGLIVTDPRWQQALATAGRPLLRRRPDGFAGLAAIVVSQQVSTASAKAIWGRLEAALEPFNHETMRQARTARLARAGLSAPKIRTLKAIARALHRGELDLAGLAALPADEAHGRLTAIHGIGPWTADIYLLFCLGHADAWPAGDLALQEAARLLFALPARPSSRDMGPLAEAWRPWRGAAAYLLWTYYRFTKQREGAAVLPTKSLPTQSLPTKTPPGAHAPTKSARSA